MIHAYPILSSYWDGWRMAGTPCSYTQSLAQRRHHYLLPTYPAPCRPSRSGGAVALRAERPQPVVRGRSTATTRRQTAQARPAGKRSDPVWKKFFGFRSTRDAAAGACRSSKPRTTGKTFGTLARAAKAVTPLRHFGLSSLQTREMIAFDNARAGCPPAPASTKHIAEDER